MSFRPLRWLHAADLCLDQPLLQTGAIPDEFVDLVADATHVAWQNLVEQALAADVDFLVLSGNSFLAGDESVRDEIELRAGFERLGEQGIPVFVVPGPLDPPEAWAESGPWPDNVTIFDSVEDEAVELTADDRPYAVIFPVNSQSQIPARELERIENHQRDRGLYDLYQVGILCPWDTNRGGRRSRRQDCDSSPRYASLDCLLVGRSQITAGLPMTEGRVQVAEPLQSLIPGNTGSHGATLIEVDAGGRLKTSLIPCAPVRWEAIPLSLTTATRLDQLVEEMSGILERRQPADCEQLWIVRWQLQDQGPLHQRLQGPDARSELSRLLRDWTDQLEATRYAHVILAPEVDLDSVAPEGLWKQYCQLLDERWSIVRPQLRERWQRLRSGREIDGKVFDLLGDDFSDEAVRQEARRLAGSWFAGTDEEAAA